MILNLINKIQLFLLMSINFLAKRVIVLFKNKILIKTLREFFAKPKKVINMVVVALLEMLIWSLVSSANIGNRK